MEFFEAISQRRSVRKYTSKQVPDQVIDMALDAALRAPNSSNLQPWEFYWVKSPDKKLALVDACLFQATAKSANHLIVAVSRIDTWKRNRDQLISTMKAQGEYAEQLTPYYFKVIPFLYHQDPFGLLSLIRWVALNSVGLFRPIARAPITRKDLFNTVTKTTALACENFMLAIAAQGYGSCPMEGFDEVMVKRLLKLGRNAQVVMVISVGEIDPEGVYGNQLRVDRNWVVKEV